MISRGVEISIARSGGELVHDISLGRFFFLFLFFYHALFVSRYKMPYAAQAHLQKKKVTPGRTPCSLCIRWSRRIERKLTFWVCGLLLGAGGQGSMPPGRTRRNQGLRR